MYKAEFFDGNFNFQSAHITDSLQLNYDYLTLEAFTVTVMGQCRGEKGSFVKISGDTQFDGIVADVVKKENSNEISIKPLLSLLDVDVFSENFTDVSSFIKTSVENYLINNPDSHQNRKIRIFNKTQSKNRTLSQSKTVVNLLNIIQQALVIHSVAVDCKLNMEEKTVDIEIFENTQEITVETGLENVIEKEVTIQDGECYNKMFIRRILKDKDTDTVSVLDTVSFYLHTDGTVSSQNINRITPVFWKAEDLEDSEDWEQKALEKATQTLTPQQYDNEINLTYLISDKTLNPAQLKIGTKARIIDNGKVYVSVLTGKSTAQSNITLMFGILRTEFTKKLIMERRKNK